MFFISVDSKEDGGAIRGHKKERAGVEKIWVATETQRQGVGSLSIVNY
jgi:hypothetical protein